MRAAAQAPAAAPAGGGPTSHSTPASAPGPSTPQAGRRKLSGLDILVLFMMFIVWVPFLLLLRIFGLWGVCLWLVLAFWFLDKCGLV